VNKLQAYKVFAFVWEFAVPLTICVVAYWQILLVLRRQAKVTSTQCRTIKVATIEPVPGPSKPKGMVNGKTERDKGTYRTASYPYGILSHKMKRILAYLFVVNVY